MKARKDLADETSLPDDFVVEAICICEDILGDDGYTLPMFNPVAMTKLILGNTHSVETIDGSDRFSAPLQELFDQIVHARQISYKLALNRDARH